MSDLVVPEDMLPMLNTGHYQMITCEEDGETYLFPILESEVIDNLDIDIPKITNTGWSNVKIPDIFTNGHFLWEPTDNFILHMYRPVMNLDDSNYVGRFSYDPITQEFLPSLISIPHHITINRRGNELYNKYIRGIYVKSKKVLLLKAYFNPLTPTGEFNPYGYYNRDEDRLKTRKTLEMLVLNGLPKDTRLIVHVTDNKIVKKYTNYA